jgi:multiple sugar transport system ATP-binding protein
MLLLDEPLSNLDAPLRAQMRTEIQNLHRRLEITMIYVTHDQAEALALGDRVAVMAEGRLQQVGPPREIYESPANRFVAGFIGSPTMNFFHGTIARCDGHLAFIGTASSSTSPATGFVLRLDEERSEAFARHEGQRVLLGFRPEHLTVTDAIPAKDPQPTITATLIALEFSGAEMILRFTVGEVTFQVRAGVSVTLTPGQSAVVTFDVRRARVFDAATGKFLF